MKRSRLITVYLTGASLAFAAPVAHAQTLTLADRAASSTLTRDALLARPDLVEVTIARDQVYGGRTMR